MIGKKLIMIWKYTRTFQLIKISRTTDFVGAFQHNSKYYKKNRTLGKNLSRNTRKYKNLQKYYLDYTLYGWERKMLYVVRNIPGRIWNQGIPRPTKMSSGNTGWQHRRYKRKINLFTQVNHPNSLHWTNNLTRIHFMLSYYWIRE